MNAQTKTIIYRISFIGGLFLILLSASTPIHLHFLTKLSEILNDWQSNIIQSTTAQIFSSDLQAPSRTQKKHTAWTLPFSFSKALPRKPRETRNPYIPIPQRITISHIEGENLQNFFATNYTSLEIMLGGTYVPGKFLPLLDFRGIRFDDTTYAASAGIVTRIIPSPTSNFCQILGFNFFYDFRQGNIGYYNQAGMGLEILGKRWDFRANLYVPFGARRKIKQCVFRYPGDYIATNDLLETVSYTFNAEVGWLAINSQYLLLYLAGGPYYISGTRLCDKARGGEFRIQPQYKDFIALNCSVSHDPIFNTVYQVEAMIHLPLYLLAKKISKKQTCKLTPRQIYQRVERFQVMPLGRASCWDTNF